MKDENKSGQNIEFEIEDRQLYLETVLITFDIALLFICIDNQDQRYIVLNTDDEKDKYVYLVTKIDNRELYNLLNCIIDIRDTFLNDKIIWRVLCDGDYKDDKVEKLSRNLKEEELPKENTYLNLKRKDIDEYKEKIENYIT